MSELNPKVDEFLNKEKHWKDELTYLRKIAQDCLLIEDFKWMHPCYTFQKSNIVLIHGFKEYCAIMFMKGALLLDEHKILFQQTENVQFGRQIRFTNLDEILKLEPILKAYIFEAIEVEKAGLKVETKKVEDYAVPEELLKKFKEDKLFKDAFQKLTPGRQKAYLLHFASAKQPKTRETRIENCVPRIMNGKGLTDCTCGLSKRMPNCDGSHKLLKSN